LSAGQRQRISLLRALLRRPRALILDEALSNLDDATEERVLRNLLSRRPQPTILWISHRTPAALRPDQRVDLSPVELPVA
jgi:ABC-type bacteriocin/lantibiotic exporter with double-glycine peptidase domain